jgi:carboxymethylenebutenolidase
MPPKTYDPKSDNEQAPPLPSALLIRLDPNIVLQPPLTRRGSGPGLILVLPDASQLRLKNGPRLLDPEPVQKWAEEGFAVAALTSSSLQSGLDLALKRAIDGLLQLRELDTRDKFGIIGSSLSSNFDLSSYR